MTRSLEIPETHREPEASREPGTRREPGLAPMRLYICTTCRDAADRAEGQPAVATDLQPVRAGAKLYAALRAAPSDPAVELIPVECLSVCTRSCAVAFAAADKWTYVYGGLPHETAAPVLLEGARLYAQTPDGLIPWKLRPAALKTGVISRVPPLPGTARASAPLAAPPEVS